MSHIFSFRTLPIFIVCLSLIILAGCARPSSQFSPYNVSTSHTGSGSAIAASAKSQLGKPYISGGISPAKGFDCSGLVYWAYASNGINIPRISKDQAMAGRQISQTELRPGDIVVFKIPRSGYHTGIYVGQNSFIHSPKPKAYVRKESLSTDYWKRYYLTARRLTAVP